MIKEKILIISYDGDIDLCSIAEWIACGFFRRKEFHKTKNIGKKQILIVNQIGTMNLGISLSKVR